MLDKMKKLFEIQKTAKKVQEQLEGTTISMDAAGGKVKMTFNGKMDIKSVEIDNSLLDVSKKNELQNGIMKCYQSALKESQTIAQNIFKQMAGPMGYPEF